jgi:hypothetical protein
VDGAELHQVRIVGSVLKFEEQSTFTKFDVEGRMGVEEVMIWLDNGNTHQAHRAPTHTSALFTFDKRATHARTLLPAA